MSNHTYRPVSDGPIEIPLVEDNPGDVRLLRDAFNATATETTLRVVSTGDDAIDFLTRRAADEPASLPDLTLLDSKLPGTDGRGVPEAIGADPRLEPLPVLVLTNSDASGDVERCYAVRADAYLRKPGDPDGFTSLVQSVEAF